MSHGHFLSTLYSFQASTLPGGVKGTWVETGLASPYTARMTKRDPFKYFKTSPEIIRLAEPPRVYRRVKHSKDEPHDEETIHPRLSG